MPQQPRKAQGRRDPALMQQPTPETGDPAVDAGLEADLDPMGRDEHDPATGQDSPTDGLVFFGDVVGANVTLAVDVTGNGKTDYIGYRHTTRVQPGESHEDVFGRLAETVGNGVISAADDAAVRWSNYQQALADAQEEQARIIGHPGGQQ